MYTLAASMVRGRAGRALITMRESEIAAKTMGVNLASYKTGAFAVSSMYAGVGGALYAFAIGLPRPSRSRWRSRSPSWPRSSSAGSPR